MHISRRSILAIIPGLGATTALSACGTSASVVVSDAQMVANDAAAVLALGIIPAPVSTIATAVLTGFQALLATVGDSVSIGATTEATAISALTTALNQVKANTATNSAANADATQALTALATLASTSNPTPTTLAQVEADIGQVLIDYLEANTPATAVPGEAQSKAATYFSDARGHISNLRNKT